MKIRFLTAIILTLGLSFISQIEAVPHSSKQYFPVEGKDIDRLKRIPTEKELVQWEEKVVILINTVRKKYNLNELSAKSNLCKTAKVHSINMAAGKVQFGHGGFDKRAESILKYGGHETFGENVAYTYLVEDPLMVSLKGWMESKGHRENILGEYDETGVGISFSKQGRCYLTQLFAKTIQK